LEPLSFGGGGGGVGDLLWVLLRQKDDNKRDIFTIQEFQLLGAYFRQPNDKSRDLCKRRGPVSLRLVLVVLESNVELFLYAMKMILSCKSVYREDSFKVMKQTFLWDG
jgi:hypothetical protein